MPTLSKSKILSGRQCHKRLWLEVHRPELIPDDPERDARFATGNLVGQIAREQWPDGVLADETSPDTSRADTARWLQEPTRPLFEGWFEHDGVRIKPDVLVPNGDGTVDLYEVKSSTSVKAYHATDVIVQSWVLRAAGLRLNRSHLTHLNNQFVYPGDGDYDGLFTHADLTDVAQDGAPAVDGWVTELKRVLDGAEPQKAIGKHCHDPFPCPFHDHCGVVTGPSNKNDPRVQAGVVAHNDEASRALAALAWPRHYLDFETVNFAVPFWRGVRPYQQVGFQWSCHTEQATGAIDHTEFLAQHDDDAPWRAFAASLVEHLVGSGQILVYNAGFERRILRETAELVPEHAQALHALVDRIVDLLPLTRLSWYHPDMHGSWSLKAVLPTIGIEESYDDLDGVAHGGDAIQAIAEYTHPDTTDTRRAELSRALRAYCALDTLAMVRLAAHLTNLT